ncbi:putative 3,4-dihydroxy-2-butanone kinase [Mangifera indica]|uniref:putative 3,4-dihydroxy-2-butanone kinase n=1 Tax=Mangifera indica TaxID=29780 RepID=UPI001CFB80E7|nr:putative 3,4-dihydroxy-2-butanone kinase [Mangifera indica]
MELGLEIHCETGAAVVDLQLVDVVVSHVLKQILSRNWCHSMVLMIVAGKAVPNLQLENGLAVNRVYTGFAIFCCLFTLLKRCFI